MNQHNVIHIMFNELPRNCCSYEQYIARIEEGLLTDLWKAYPDVGIKETDAVWDALTKVFEYGNGDKFIFVLDEWDYIYHQKFVTEEEKDDFTKFLSNLLKDKAFVDLAYMTGILPIACACTAYRTQESFDSFVDPSGESLQAVFHPMGHTPAVPN